MTVPGEQAHNEQPMSDKEFEALKKAHFFMEEYMKCLDEARKRPWWEKALGVFGIRRIVR
ncbi:hypothetical protein WM42_2574 [Corynebacterium simulans]|uniref:hypothetical protein n=1 Tax=Corynebacterium TaxID=1716 RepID=UPI0007858787|nr:MULTISPECIES: hypothetical protein [Corynebacterium]AMO90264.1 hypothetical protein WM42_2574 [Corynebacterium simulans]OFQ49464.1 hypothetical protein HMPREF2935_10940 [Corynebacterium sp. HMSC076D02]